MHEADEDAEPGDAVDIEHLAAKLGSEGMPTGTLTVDALDGLLAALALSAEGLSAERWLPLVFGGGMPMHLPEEELGELVLAVTQRAHEVAKEISDGIFAPLIPFAGGEPQPRAWAEAFMAVVRLQPKGWQALIDSEKNVFLAPMAAPCILPNGLYAVDMNPASRKRLTAKAPDAITDAILKLAEWRGVIQFPGLSPDSIERARAALVAGDIVAPENDDEASELGDDVDSDDLDPEDLADQMLDFEWLAETLISEAMPEGTFSFCELDGFLAGIALSPVPIAASNWMPVVFGGVLPQIADKELEKALLSAIADYGDGIRAEIEDGSFEPLLPLDDAGKPWPQPWALAFMEAVGLAEEIWRPLLESAEHGEMMLPILALCEDPDVNAAMKITKRELRDLKANAEEALTATVQAVAEFHGVSSEPVYVPPQQPITRSGPKVGRNDPCPCGSGKKYKKCCGAN